MKYKNIHRTGNNNKILESMKSQTERLKTYLDNGNSITRLDAFKKLGIFELSARIVGLQKLNYPIKKDWIKVSNRYGESVSVVKYSKG